MIPPTLTPPSPARSMTLADYRALEETARDRHEYHDGEIIPMTGGTLEHSAIAGNIYAVLKPALRKTRLKPFNSDLRVWIPQYQRGLYPDVTVIEGEPQLNDGRRDEILNPQLIVEVLSDSTEAYDRGDKFMYYRSIASLSEYVLVNQYRPAIERYTRVEPHQWLMESYEGLEAIVRLKLANLELSAADIYEDVIFPSLDLE